MDEINMKQINNEIKIIVREEYAEEFEKIEREIEELKIERNKLKIERNNLKIENQELKKKLKLSKQYDLPFEVENKIDSPLAA